MIAARGVSACGGTSRVQGRGGLMFGVDVHGHTRLQRRGGRLRAGVLTAALAALMLPRASYAGEYPHVLGIGLGPVHDQVRDDVLTPLRWDGFGPRLDFTYERGRGTSRHTFELGFPVGILRNRYDARGYMLELKAGYGYRRTLAVELAGGRVRAGGRFAWSFNEQFYEDWDDAHAYWLNVYGLGPWATVTRWFGARHRLELGIDFPLVALTSRPPRHHFYKIDELDRLSFHLTRPHESMTVTSIHRYVALALRCDYSREGGGFPFGASVLLDYKTHREPERIRILTLSLLVRVLIRWGGDPEEAIP